jgi:hypothetical protein
VKLSEVESRLDDVHHEIGFCELKGTSEIIQFSHPFVPLYLFLPDFFLKG